MTRSLGRFVLVLSLTASVQALAQIPVISSVAPLSGPPGTIVTAAGTNFSSVPADNIVYIGPMRAPVLTASPTVLTVQVPPGCSYVNNNAAATLLVLAALARGREVLVSRGELVEIGGGFRVPEVMAQSGCVLREVGTTNRTRAADYAAAIGDRTALILRVHPSNFRIEGFTERPDARELVALGRQFGIPVVEDPGSGNLLGHVLAEASFSDEGFPTRRVEEPTVQESVATGFDVVCFSGDKLLGGPQARVILGREDRQLRHRWKQNDPGHCTTRKCLPGWRALFPGQLELDP